MPDEVRLDSWLWAARFFKTRSLAKQAIEGGKVTIQGQRAKPGKTITPGTMLQIGKADQTFEVEVLGLATKRGPARVAEQLYRETPASAERREKASSLRRAERASRPTPAGRPDKRDRRTLRRLRKDGGED